MIEIDFKNRTLTCPYCGSKQSYTGYEESGCHEHTVGFFNEHSKQISGLEDATLKIVEIFCRNNECGKLIVVGRFNKSGQQVDIMPTYSCKSFPEYIPKQIIDDYTEASAIIELSPKAAATLFRRCLQGMISDFWHIHEKNLNASITALKDKIVDKTQWAAIDGLRKLGNIGAHMEQDINVIVDIEPNEAAKLKFLIEHLLDEWYISRHKIEELYNDIVNISDAKQQQRKHD